MNYEAVRHFALPSSIGALVESWFAGHQTDFELDGERSVRLPHPDRPGRLIKIKGAGLNGGPIDFSKRMKSGLRAPLFDFDGRMMEDVASGHDNAFLGGSTFQQATIEARLARILAQLGYGVVPCLGYGWVEQSEVRSWFTVYELEHGWRSINLPDFPVEEYGTVLAMISELCVEIAVKHALIGYFWCVGEPGGPYHLKDLHPFRKADPLNMSALSWVMQVYFALHINVLAVRHFVAAAKLPEDSRNVHLAAFRPFVPDVSADEFEEFRHRVVAPYMLRPPVNFDPQTLYDELEKHRITRVLSRLCPEEYASL